MVATLKISRRQVFKHSLLVRAKNRTVISDASTCISPTPCRTKRTCTYEDRTRLESCSRDPIGYEDGWNLYRAYFAPNSTDPFGLSLLGSFGSGIVQGVIGGAIVVGVGTLAVTLGAPIAVVTIGLGVVAVIGVAILVSDTIEDPSAENIAENAGVLVGGAIVGGTFGRPLACRLSPPGNQPPPGPINMGHEISQGFHPRPGTPIVGQIMDAMGQGPTTGGSAGSITIGAGIGDPLN